MQADRPNVTVALTPECSEALEKKRHKQRKHNFLWFKQEKLRSQPRGPCQAGAVEAKARTVTGARVSAVSGMSHHRPT